MQRVPQRRAPRIMGVAVRKGAAIGLERCSPVRDQPATLRRPCVSGLFPFDLPPETNTPSPRPPPPSLPKGWQGCGYFRRAVTVAKRASKEVCASGGVLGKCFDVRVYELESRAAFEEWTALVREKAGAAKGKGKGKVKVKGKGKGKEKSLEGASESNSSGGGGGGAGDLSAAAAVALPVRAPSLPEGKLKSPMVWKDFGLGTAPGKSPTYFVGGYDNLNWSLTHGSGGLVWNKDETDESTAQDYVRYIIGYVGVAIAMVLALVLCLHPGVAPGYRAFVAVPVAVGVGSIGQVKVGA